MRARQAVVAVVILLVLPRVAAADFINLQTDVDQPGGFPTLVFGTAPATGHFDFLNMLVNGAAVVVDPSSGSGVTGSVAFSSGALLDLDVTTGPSGEVTAHYLYDIGEFIVEAEWTTPQGAVMTGSYVAPLVNLSIDTCEGDCFAGLATAAFSAALGPGTFDPVLAQVLGISPASAGGTFLGFLDFIDGDPTTADRVGGAPAPWGVTIDVASVPEPGLTALGGLIAASLWLRRWRGRGAGQDAQGPQRSPD